MRSDSWRLTEGLIFVHFAVFILSWANREGLTALALLPGQVVQRPWTLVTYQFVHGSSMFWFFISMLVLWIMAKPLEESWGSPRFLVFWLVATFGASLTATALGLPLAGDTGVGTSILLTFATLYPEVEFRLFFLIPVKVKYLAVVAAAWLAFVSLQLGLLAGVANVAGMSAGYLFFLATRKLPSRRKIGFELKKRKAVVEAKAETVVVEHRNQAWDPKIREAVARAAAAGAVASEDEALLAELDGSRDPSITVCAPTEFGLIDDDICRTCPGFAECGARAIRMAAGGEGE
ncbi:MAG: rhomboid family intramembrane serine protease [Thermoanaerobaculales bacterium]|jgi:membrane associated rhomboid family serine protease|nr:rhomboid family intramembrane serine protease [Thermoanaerobaculales bacterium]